MIRVLAALLLGGGVAVAQRATETPPVQLAPVDVNASALNAVDPTAFKLPLNLHDTPRSLTVLDDAWLRERNVQRVQEALAYVPGFSAFGVNEDTYRFYVRGFNMGPDDTRFDGFSGYAIDMTQSPSLFGIERVVFLRGPAGLLYGATALPGGMINLVGKKPREGAFTQVDAHYETYAGGGIAPGSHSSRSVEFDTNGRAGGNAHLLYRLNAIVDDRGFYNDGIRDRHRGLLAALTWKFGAGDRFELTPLFQYQTHPFAYGRGFALSPSTSLGVNDGRTGPVNVDDLSPVSNYLSGGIRTLFQRIAGIDGRATLSSAWRVNASYRYISANASQYQFVLQPATLRQLNRGDPSSWVIDRRQTVRETDRRNHGLDVNTSFETSPMAAVKNLAQLGWNGRIYRTTRERSAATQPNQSPINIYTGAAATPLIDRHPPLVDSFLTDDFYWNLYAQDQTSFGEKWVTTVSVGYGEQEFGRDYPATLAPSANLAKIVATRRGEITPNLGLVYHASRMLAAYASYSTSYSPAPGDSENQAGATGEFRPITGRSYEAGLKFDATERRASATVSVYQTELDNVLVQSEPTQLNVRGNRYFVQAGGGRRARGVEFAGEVRPVPSWRVAATAAYVDARYRGEGRIVGARLERTPPLAVSLDQRYDVGQGWLKGWSGRLGIIWQDARWSVAPTAAAPDPLLLPGFARVDAGVGFRATRWEFALNAENIFDRRYFYGGSTGSALEVAAPRTLSLRVSFQR